MHPHLIDWFRTTHIHTEAKVVEQRWKTAAEYSKKLSRETVISLLRIFLFEQPPEVVTAAFTNGLLAIDKEFPIQNNLVELRLMAGVVMAAAFNDGTPSADAFALGLQAANFPVGRARPAHPDILVEGHKYLAVKAEERRPGNFDALPSDIEENLLAKNKAIIDAEAAADAAKTVAARNGYSKTVAKGIRDANQLFSGQIRRLAEESAVLWWVVSENSFTLNSPTEKLTAPEFALVAAAEAAQRTHILPPASSMNALLDRVLSKCKSNPKKDLSLENYLSSSDAGFRASQVANINVGDCMDLVPLATALAKCQEFGEVSAAIKVLPKLCPGFAVDRAVSPNEISHQYYRELIFHKSLAALKG